MLDKQLLTTLRFHSAPITCIEPFYLPSPLTYNLKGNNNETIPIFNPSLITADESGLIIWWNLSSRRPLGIWKGHDDSILTIKQLGINWTLSENSNRFKIPQLTVSYGQLLTHSKDGSIKIWKLIDLLDESNSQFIYSSILKKKISCTDEELMKITPPKLYELPVNTLNFTNIDINSQNKLITPATVDSESWDLYEIDLTQTDEFKKLKRLIQNYRYQEISNDEVQRHLSNDSTDLNLTQRGGNGVIMKIKWINNTRFIIGYENGKVIIYEIIENLNNIQCLIIHEDSSLFGNPITSITIDNNNNKLLWASSASKVCILDISTDNFEKPIIFETKHKGIADIDVDFSTNSIGLITWDGYTRLYEYDEQNGMKFVFKIRRQLPTIFNSKEAVDYENNEGGHSNKLQTQRASIIKFTEKQIDLNNNKDIKINYTNGLSKNVVKRNREEIYRERWMFVGYHDGKIAVYSIK
jgi:hypothetical protein